VTSSRFRVVSPDGCSRWRTAFAEDKDEAGPGAVGREDREDREDMVEVDDEDDGGDDARRVEQAEGTAEAPDGNSALSRTRRERSRVGSDSSCC
jgi:hypothetical protein